MSTVQLIQVTPEDLASLISEKVKSEIQTFAENFTLKTNHLNLKEVLDRKEVSELFGISLTTLHAWINDGILNPSKIGGRLYFKRDELLSLLTKKNEK